MSPEEIISILSYYKYWIIFPVAVFEGPIIAIICGFLVYLGILNGVGAYVIMVVADTIGDSLYYLLGRFWRYSDWVKKYSTFLGYSEKSEEYLENHFNKHKAKTFLLAKISHGIGGSVQIASGIAKVSYKDFFIYSVLGTVPKVFILLLIGFYLGSSYEKIDGYLQLIAFGTIGIVVLFILYKIFNKKIKDYLIQ